MFKTVKTLLVLSVIMASSAFADTDAVVVTNVLLKAGARNPEAIAAFRASGTSIQSIAVDDTVPGVKTYTFTGMDIPLDIPTARLTLVVEERRVRSGFGFGYVTDYKSTFTSTPIDRDEGSRCRPQRIMCMRGYHYDCNRCVQ